MNIRNLSIKFLAIIGLVSFIPLVSSCLSDDDIPYPRVRANIIAMDVEGQLRATAIDTLAGSVTIFLNDSVDIRNLRLTRFEVTPGASVIDTTVLCKPLDLSDTMRLTLHIYQDWPWKIAARQDINRVFTVSGQIGQSVIDPVAHTVTASVPASVSLDHITVTSVRLGGATSVISPDLLSGPVNFSQPVTVDVTEFGRTTTWTITISTAEVVADITSVDAWTQVAWVHANVQEGKPVSFEYRIGNTSEWKAVPQQWISSNGSGSYTARIIHLSPLTTYVTRAVSGDDMSSEVEFTTGASIQAPDNSFNNWWLDGKVWCPWPEDGDKYWGTGNKGATTLGDSNTTPIRDSESATGFAGASLLTKFVGIGMLGKLAAGNLFAGSYVRTDGTNGVLSFGRPFKMRPTALRATIQYNSVPISNTNSEFSYLKGQPDTCVVWAALSDAAEPLEIRTKPSDRQLFDENADYVVAYGRYQYSGAMSDFITVDIPLDYRATDRIPNYILMVASASKYGDYFTGGAGSLLLVRKLELIYDYSD